MSGHKDPPNLKDYGRQIDAYLSALKAWKATPAGTVLPGPAIPGSAVDPFAGLTDEEIADLFERGLGGDTGGTTTSFSGGAARTFAEELRYLEEKYKWDSKLELEVLASEWDKRGQHDVKLSNLDFKHQKWLQDKGYKQDVKMADLSQAHKLEFLRIEIGLSHENKILLMDKQHGWDVIEAKEGRDFTLLRDANNQDFTSSENNLDRELKVATQALDIKAQQALQAARLAAEQAMQQAGFGHSEKMQAGQQAFDKVMQAAGFKHDEFIQARELTMRLTINQNNIKSSEAIAQKKIDADFKMQDKQIAFDKEQKEEDRKLRRFEEVQKLRGRDPVRAALMAMGVGDPNDPMGSQFGDLGSMVGMQGEDLGEALRTTTESALQGIEGLGAAGESLTLGNTGVEGLQSVEKAATSSVTGPDATKILIESAQGVGSSKQAGVDAERVAKRIESVTPKGVNIKGASRGVGPQLTPMVNQEYAAVGRGEYLKNIAKAEASRTGSGGNTRAIQPVANAPRSVARTRPAVEPNTSYTVGEGQRGDGTRPEVVTTGKDNELLSIEPASDETRPADGQRGIQPVSETKAGGDPLVDMFNDPDLKLGRGEPIKAELPPVGGEVVTPQPPPITPQQKQINDFKVRMDTQFRDEMTREGINENEMKQIQAIKASGQPLSPQQEQALAKYDRIVKGYQEANQNYSNQILGQPAVSGGGGVPALSPIGNGVELTIPGTMGGGAFDPVIAAGGGFVPPNAGPGELTATTMGPESLDKQQIRAHQLQQQTRRQEYLAQLPPAQQAAIRQAGQQRIGKQQDALAGSLTPQTIEKLMTLINNPNREVNRNLQEVLPQLRDGAGNIRQAQPQNLARVV